MYMSEQNFNAATGRIVYIFHKFNPARRSLNFIQ